MTSRKKALHIQFEPFPLVKRLRRLRILQYVIALVNIVTSSYLAAFLTSKNASIGGAVPVPIIEAGLTFIITGLGQWIGIHFSGYRKRGWLVTFIFFDILCIGLQIPTIIVLAVAGLPSNCNGVANGLDSDVFGTSGHTLTERYCAVPKSNFWLSIISMVLYVYTISIVIRQIRAVNHYLKNCDEQRGATEDVERLNATADSQGASRRCCHATRSPRGFVNAQVESETTSNHEQVDTPAYSQTSGSVAGEQPPPYVPNERPDLATSLKKK